jgi:hypothetical protein
MEKFPHAGSHGPAHCGPTLAMLSAAALLPHS